MKKFASEFRPGKVLFDGKEAFITKVEPFNEKCDILYIDGKTYTSKTDRIIMVEIGALSPEEMIKKQAKMDRAGNRLTINQQFLEKFPASDVSIGQIMNWKDEIGEGFQDDNYVLRTMEGDGPLVVYDPGGKLEESEVTKLKTDYGVFCDINFLDVRPITFGNWKELPNKRKLASKLDRDESKKRKIKRKSDIIGKHD
jgi:hypothetical protein